MLTAFILVCVTFYLLISFLKPKRHPNFPPGPPSYPVLGCGLFLSKLGKGKASYETFAKLGEIYGPVTGLENGGTNTIVINGYEASKEFYTQDKFISRPDFFTISARWNGRLLGVFFSSGRLWQEQKRFTLRHLRDFGFGKTSMEELIHEEAEECIGTIKKDLDRAGPGSVITIHDKFGVSMINILWAITAGKRFNHDDPELAKLLDILKETFRAGQIQGVGLNLLNKYQWLQNFPYFKQLFHDVMNGLFGLDVLLKKTIEDHEKTFNPNVKPRDFIDVYLKAMKDSKDDPDSTFFHDQLGQVLSDLFGAGSESTSNSVAFAMLHMLRNPECQAKVQKELDEVVGRSRLPSYNDRAKLPYTFAAITESFRMTPIAPLSVPHTNTEDTDFMDYRIPKNSFVMVNYSTTNMDKNYWGDPEVFRPERFLDVNGEFDKSKLDHVMGFGAGKRVCLGESLARICNFILFSSVIQRFKLELVPGQPKPTLKVHDGFTVSPLPFSAKVTVRY